MNSDSVEALLQELKDFIARKLLAYIIWPVEDKLEDWWTSGHAP